MDKTLHADSECNEYCLKVKKRCAIFSITSFVNNGKNALD